MLVRPEGAEISADLVSRDKKRRPQTVRYEAVNAMLLDEFLKEYRKVQELEKQTAQTKTASGVRSAKEAGSDLTSIEQRTSNSRQSLARVFTGLCTVADAGCFSHSRFAPRYTELRAFAAKDFQTVASVGSQQIPKCVRVRRISSLEDPILVSAWCLSKERAAISSYVAPQNPSGSQGQQGGPGTTLGHENNYINGLSRGGFSQSWSTNMGRSPWRQRWL